MISRILFGVILVGCLSGSAQAGFIEICKDSNPAGSVTGLFNFSVAGQVGMYAAPVGACSPAFQLPDGPAFITEVPQAGSMIFGVSAYPTTRLDSFDPIMGTAKVEIVPGDISTQTIVTFTNTPASTGVPEPASVWLFGLGLTVCWAARRNFTRRC